jgi:nucleoside-triphosphatase THEP1
VASTHPFVVLIGLSGAGKSTICRAVVARARERGRPVAGILTRPRTGGDPQRALDAEDASTGATLALAERGTVTGGPTVGPWHFHHQAFDAGLRWCEQAETGALLIVDEVGPLELRRQQGWAPLLPRLPVHQGPVLMVIRPALAGDIPRLSGDRTVLRVDVTADTRDSALARVLRELGLDA